MRILNENELKTILENHKLWLINDTLGICADLSSANLRGANLRGADLYGLKKQLLDHIHKHSIVPEEGQFIGYKKLASGSIATLLIPKSAIRYGGLVGRKCRASKVKVLKIELEGKEIKKDVDKHTGKLEYQVGKWIKPDRFDDDFTKECTNGIHFFITKKEAENY